MRLSALSEVLPGEPVTNAQMAERFGLHEKWLDVMTGNRSRYFCSADSHADVPSTTEELAAAAGQASIDAAGIDPSSIDFLVLSTATPDHLMPATVNLVADRLGIDGVPAVQLMSGCAGALQGLFVARSMLAGGLRRGLVIGADCCRKIFPTPSGVKEMKPAELINFALFGDGAGAAVVEATGTPHAGPVGVPALQLDHLFVRTIGRGRTPGQIANWYGAEGAPATVGADGKVSREQWGFEDYKSIEREVPVLAGAILDELVAETGWRLEDVEHVLTPQLNGVMTEKIRERIGVRPEQAVSCVADTGNNGNALPYIQLHRAVQRMSAAGAGDRVLVAAVESSKWIVSGMALRAVQQDAPARTLEVAGVH